MSDSPYQTPMEPSKGFESIPNDPRALFEPLYERRLWARIMGIVFMLLGGLYCITIIGAIFGLPIGFAGYYLYKSADHLDAAFQGQIGQLREASRCISLSFLIGGIMVLIWVVVMILYFGVVFLALGVGAFSAAGA